MEKISSQKLVPSLSASTSNSSSEHPFGQVAEALSQDAKTRKRKREYALIENKSKRQVRFNKRKKSLFKKAIELSRLCDAHVTIHLLMDSKVHLLVNDRNTPLLPNGEMVEFVTNDDYKRLAGLDSDESEDEPSYVSMIQPHEIPLLDTTPPNQNNQAVAVPRGLPVGLVPPHNPNGPMMDPRIPMGRTPNPMQQQPQLMSQPPIIPPGMMQVPMRPPQYLYQVPQASPYVVGPDGYVFSPSVKPEENILDDQSSPKTLEAAPVDVARTLAGMADS